MMVMKKLAPGNGEVPGNWIERVIAAGIPVYGDITFRGDCSLEDADLIEFFNDLKYDFPLLSKIAIHVKNEGERSKAQAVRERMKGALQKGATDVQIPGNPSFIMELKRQNYLKSKILEEQITYMVHSMRAGAFVCVCLGIDAARDALADWIKLSFGDNPDMRIEE
ncbi:DNA nuclease [Pantoea phage Nafs113]|nr:DNA nuclease [Pantoea phage Nafs113]